MTHEVYYDQDLETFFVDYLRVGLNLHLQVNRPDGVFWAWHLAYLVVSLRGSCVLEEFHPIVCECRALFFYPPV